MSTQPKNIHLAEPLLAQLEDAARSLQRTPDELVDDAVRAFLRERLGRDLFAYGERKGAEIGIREEDVPEIVHEWRREQRQRNR